MAKVDNKYLIELLSDLICNLTNMDDNSEQEQALYCTEELLNAAQNPKSNDFILTEKGSEFIQKITLLQGGFGSNKLVLDKDSKILVESIKSELPKERTKFSTFFVPWG
ncbi:hypothetical protein [Pediococcus argentinicus]|uniref:Uncharacterized protein n=1 Tax=Pediococcus argentinicus TaxID=480391 RepID=A0A0R2N990_9LACO|nr:hypothetical protein [Pediococcus argentinicus]KRO22389.1 hypothetical protein IV88_GL001174 [Pediococcus argentinicus]NKZ22885.1 hypothetical protein [Pediococcus argentinicus]GEP20149.1 hypothetical protein LSA03_15330 [Pediococcus argentinicus]